MCASNRDAVSDCLVDNSWLLGGKHRAMGSTGTIWMSTLVLCLLAVCTACSQNRFIARRDRPLRSIPHTRAVAPKSAARVDAGFGRVDAGFGRVDESIGRLDEGMVWDDEILCQADDGLCQTEWIDLTAEANVAEVADQILQRRACEWSN